MALKILLDANRYCDLMRGNPEVLNFLQDVESIYIPFITLAELRSGFSLGTKGAENEKTLNRFLLRASVVSLYPDEATTRQYAAIFLQLRLQGTPIPTNDIWIAALALHHGLTLYARDSHFDHLPQLSRA